MHWNYPFLLPRLDIQGDFRTNPPELFSRLTGVDGRYRGRLRRFPGFLKRYSDVAQQPPAMIDGSNTWEFGGQNGVEILEPFAIQQGPSASNIVRGVVYLITNASISDALAVTYSVNGGTVTSDLLHTFAGNRKVNYMDIAVDHGVLYIVGELDETATDRKEKIELVARYTGLNNKWQAVTWPSNVREFPDMSSLDNTKAVTHNNDSAADVDGSWLTDVHFYGLTMRVVYPDQGFIGPLVTPIQLFYDKAQTGGQNDDGDGWMGIRTDQMLEMLGDVATMGNVFTRALVQLFRGVGQKTIGSSIDIFETDFEIRGSLNGRFPASPAP